MLLCGFHKYQTIWKELGGQSSWKGRRVEKLVLGCTDLASDYLFLSFSRLIKLAKSSKAASTHTLHRIGKTSNNINGRGDGLGGNIPDPNCAIYETSGRLLLIAKAEGLG